MLIHSLPEGARVLEVGGGASRVLKAFSKRFECWNVDKFEGLGNGPISQVEADYACVRAYMGDYSEDLPNDYFDPVFSISALEHVDDASLHPAVCEDITRVLKPGDLSAQLLDVVFRPNGGFWTNAILQEMVAQASALNHLIAPEAMRAHPDLYVMGKQSSRRYFSKKRPK